MKFGHWTGFLSGNTCTMADLWDDDKTNEDRAQWEKNLRYLFRSIFYLDKSLAPDDEAQPWAYDGRISQVSTETSDAIEVWQYMGEKESFAFVVELITTIDPNFGRLVVIIVRAIPIEEWGRAIPLWSGSGLWAEVLQKDVTGTKSSVIAALSFVKCRVEAFGRLDWIPQTVANSIFHSWKAEMENGCVLTVTPRVLTYAVGPSVTVWAWTVIGIHKGFKRTRSGTAPTREKASWEAFCGTFIFWSSLNGVPGD